jgi:quercetin dioxygenase-like cupin family protein
LPRHTDSAEETIVVIGGTMELQVEGARSELAVGDLAVVPAQVPHEVRNSGDDKLRFFALYADTDVVTRYEAEVQPDGAKSRRPAS